MAAVPPSTDTIPSELMQNLSLESTAINDMNNSGNRGGFTFSASARTSKPFYPNSYSNATYYYDYSDQANYNGGMVAQGAYGNTGLYTYDQVAYEMYPSVPGTNMQNDGHVQQYQYPYVSQRTSSAPSSAVINKGNMNYQGRSISTAEYQPTIFSNAGLHFDKQYKHGAKYDLSVKDISAYRNNLSLPYYTGARTSNGVELFSDLLNGMYQSNKMYGQYGNTWSSSSYGSVAYGSREGHTLGKFKSSNNNRGGSGTWKKNVDGLDEINKGPRATNPDNKSDGDNKEVSQVMGKEQNNGEDLSENYSDAKFFVIKSYSEDDIHKSIKYNVWASTPNGNKKLNAAYEEAKEKPGGCPVFLLFSVNSSGQFVGLAEMVGPVDFESSVQYWQTDRWTGCFPLKWHIIKDIPNVLLRKITLENNENRPVTNSRDTQEVMFEKGIQILNLFKEHQRKTCVLDDFDFYESREKLMQERKSKEHKPSRQVNELGDNKTNETDELPESDGVILANQAASDEVGSDEAVADSSELLKMAQEDPIVASDEVARIC